MILFCKNLTFGNILSPFFEQKVEMSKYFVKGCLEMSSFGSITMGNVKNFSQYSHCVCVCFVKKILGEPELIFLFYFQNYTNKCIHLFETYPFQIINVFSMKLHFKYNIFKLQIYLVYLIQVQFLGIEIRSFKLLHVCIKLSFKTRGFLLSEANTLVRWG